MPSQANIRPWWQSSFMWDGLSSGGIGVTGPAFRHFGGVGDPLDSVASSNTKKVLLANGAVLGGSIVGGLLGYGLFGTLKDRGWGSWSAGALTGLLGGLGALVMLNGVGLLTGKKFVGRLR